MPIAWSEQFSLDQPKSPVMTALEKDYRVKLIDLPSQLPKGAVLLAAQPRALPAEELVKLDAWVRAGGRLLLLADPMLEWPSDLPLGDKRRAPTAFADTGLLQHWGLRLDAPEHRGPVQSQIGGRPVQTASPGLLVLERGRCRFSDQGFVGRCAIGRGQVTVIADADFLNVGTDDPNLFALESQLASLTR
nr:DUF4350 domain-containing protein [Sphingomonas alba]